MYNLFALGKLAKCLLLYHSNAPSVYTFHAVELFKEKVFTFQLHKHAYINFDPFKPHFYIVKLGFTGVYIIFLIFLKA